MLLLKVALVRKWRRPDRFNKAVKVTISRRYQIDAGIIWLHIQGQSAPLRREGFCPVLAKRIIRNRTCADPRTARAKWRPDRYQRAGAGSVHATEEEAGKALEAVAQVKRPVGLSGSVRRLFRNCRPCKKKDRMIGAPAALPAWE
jgi:hypothetical protein